MSARASASPVVSVTPRLYGGHPYSGRRLPGTRRDVREIEPPVKSAPCARVREA